MRFLGASILDAIDWMQDKLHTTRPLAESTLFSLIADKKVRETEEGYVLLEDSDDEVQKRHSQRVHHRASRPKGVRPRARVHRKKARTRYTNKLKHMDYPEAASEMDELPGDDDAVS